PVSRSPSAVAAAAAAQNAANAAIHGETATLKDVAAAGAAATTAAEDGTSSSEGIAAADVTLIGSCGNEAPSQYQFCLMIYERDGNVFASDLVVVVPTAGI